MRWLRLFVDKSFWRMSDYFAFLSNCVTIFWKFSRNFWGGFCCTKKEKKKKDFSKIAFYFLAFPKGGLGVFL
jgi:hypothetical protein